MLALLIEDVTLIKQREITATVRFRGGVTTTLTLPRPLSAPQLRATYPDVRQHIDQLLDEYTDAQVAHILNQRGMRTGAGDAFDTQSVQWLRYSDKIKGLKQRLLDAGWLTVEQLSARLGLSPTSIGCPQCGDPLRIIAAGGYRGRAQQSKQDLKKGVAVAIKAPELCAVDWRKMKNNPHPTTLNFT